MTEAPVIHDAEIAEVMTEIALESFPGLVWLEVK